VILWFVRFGTTAKCKRLAIGNSKGEIKLWDIDDGNSNKKSLCVLTHAQCTSTIQMISFCPDSTCFVAVCDEGRVWKWDAMHS
jgi:WD40 repeat protein